MLRDGIVLVTKKMNLLSIENAWPLDERVHLDTFLLTFLDNVIWPAEPGSNIEKLMILCLQAE